LVRYGVPAGLVGAMRVVVGGGGGGEVVVGGVQVGEVVVGGVHVGEVLVGGVLVDGADSGCVLGATGTVAGATGVVVMGWLLCPCSFPDVPWVLVDALGVLLVVWDTPTVLVVGVEWDSTRKATVPPPARAATRSSSPSITGAR
jgi:hypothetical protein